MTYVLFEPCTNHDLCSLTTVPADAGPFYGTFLFILPPKPSTSALFSLPTPEVQRRLPKSITIHTHITPDSKKDAVCNKNKTTVS